MDEKNTMKKFTNSFLTISPLLLFSACSSMQVTEESVADQSVAGVSLATKSIATQAVLANAVVYFENDQFNNIVNNQHLPIIQHELMNDDCDTDRYEQFTYCPANKKIVQYEIDMFVSPEQLLNNIHWNQDSEYFIGHSNDEILLKSSYWQGPSTRILAYNEKTKILRETQLIPIRITDSEVKGVSRHKFLKMVNGDGTYSLCTNI